MLAYLGSFSFFPFDWQRRGPRHCIIWFLYFSKYRQMNSDSSGGMCRFRVLSPFPWILTFETDHSPLLSSFALRMAVRNALASKSRVSNARVPHSYPKRSVIWSRTRINEDSVLTFRSRELKKVWLSMYSLWKSWWFAWYALSLDCSCVYRCL